MKDLTLKQLALKDMRASNINTSVFYLEVAILEYTKEDSDNYNRRDFRRYNGIPHRYKKR